MPPKSGPRVGTDNFQGIPTVQSKGAQGSSALPDDAFDTPMYEYELSVDRRDMSQIYPAMDLSSSIKRDMMDRRAKVRATKAGPVHCKKEMY